MRGFGKQSSQRFHTAASVSDWKAGGGEGWGGSGEVRDVRRQTEVSCRRNVRRLFPAGNETDTSGEKMRGKESQPVY